MIPYKYSQLKNKLGFFEAKSKYASETKYFHLGQLKLFFTEMFFLSKHGKPGNKVLYVGAANGYHIEKLAELFPELYFDLWDPGRFEVKESANIKIYNQYFSNTDAKKYTSEGANILFMCDIRTLKIAQFVKQKDEEAIDNLVADDMIMQADWVKIINPKYAYLKFRLPYTDITKFKYLKGTIYLQPYSPISTETRLMTNNYNTYIEYDSVEYDEKLAYFNFVTRQNYRSDKWTKCLNEHNINNEWDNILALYISKFYIFNKLNVKSNNAACKLFMDIVAFHQKRYGDKYDMIFQKKND